MANIIPFAFRGELFSGTHNFASGGDAFKIALYTGLWLQAQQSLQLTLLILHGVVQLSLQHSQLFIMMTNQINCV
jgi:hypothetical protein